MPFGKPKAKPSKDLEQLPPGVNFSTQMQIARAYGLSCSRITQLYRTRPDFPPKQADGTWDRAAIAEFMSSVIRKRNQETGGGNKDTKTGLECDRLKIVIKREKEMLEQQQMETARLKRELVARSEIMQDDIMRASKMRGCIEAWRQHEGAKTPALSAAVDHLVETLLEQLRGLEYARQG
jgi:hypothetical protein